MINENYNFIPTKKIIIFKYLIYPFILIYCKLIIGFKVVGKENIDLIKNGSITVGNHIHFMDNVLIFLALFPKNYYFITNKINIETSLIRFFVRGLGGIPVPESKKIMKNYIECLEKLIKEGNNVHFFPEGSIKPYHHTIRKFNDGPFRIAINNNLPIIPLTFIYQLPTGILKYIRKKPFIHLVIDRPIYSSGDYHKFKSAVHEKMESIIHEYEVKRDIER
jgi:1-acyl-sn-glycerol-3-phosphate acyltransferase